MTPFIATETVDESIYKKITCFKAGASLLSQTISVVFHFPHNCILVTSSFTNHLGLFVCKNGWLKRVRENTRVC